MSPSLLSFSPRFCALRVIRVHGNRPLHRDCQVSRTSWPRATQEREGESSVRGGGARGSRDETVKVKASLWSTQAWRELILVLGERSGCDGSGGNMGSCSGRDVACYQAKNMQLYLPPLFVVPVESSRMGIFCVTASKDFGWGFVDPVLL